MEDWDLQAVVRGCNNNTTIEAFENKNTPQSLLSLSRFPDLFEFTSEDFDQSLHKIIDQQVVSSQSIFRNTSCLSIPTSVLEPEKLQNKRALSQYQTPSSFKSDGACVTGKAKKRRRNQQKREVKHVKADDLSSDMWAWRKYGQKPIKGSPHPRSYYRCSSLKGCLARKKVERSSSDPSMFIITYTSEHSHAHPARRNSLAGTTRTKSLMAKKPNNKLDKSHNQLIKNECSDTLLPCSTTTSVASTIKEDELVQNGIIKNEEEEEDNSIDIASKEEIVMPEIMFSEDLFPSLDDFEGLFLDQFSYATDRP